MNEHYSKDHWTAPHILFDDKRKEWIGYDQAGLEHYSHVSYDVVAEELVWYELVDLSPFVSDLQVVLDQYYLNAKMLYEKKVKMNQLCDDYDIKILEYDHFTNTIYLKKDQIRFLFFGTKKISKQSGIVSFTKGIADEFIRSNKER